jgi:transposase
MVSRGRPSKFDPVRVERLTWLLAHGMDRGAAAEDVGIGRATFYRWLGDQRPQYDALRAAVTRAEAEAQAAVTWNIVRRSATDWRAGLAWLESRYPEQWGRRRSAVSRRKSRN